uniref:Hemerythrin-like metal-binding protein n=1 Tax=Solibacter usitatus (strain Ellin6076) TaxID=234267 RepID=Q01U15_SOLUE
MFDWKPQFAVGIPSIDAQHQKLFAIARELYEAMSAGRGKASLALILDRLVRYTATHFAHEERLMRIYEYPDFVRHKAQHDALTKQVLGFQKEFDAGMVSMTVQLLQFLKNWLENHIQVSDFEYGPCLKQKNVA